MKYVLVNRRKDPSDDRIFVATEYDYGGETKILPPDSRTVVKNDSEASVALSRFQNVGLSLEYEKDVADAG